MNTKTPVSPFAPTASAGLVARGGGGDSTLAPAPVAAPPVLH